MVTPPKYASVSGDRPHLCPGLWVCLPTSATRSHCILDTCRRSQSGRINADVAADLGSSMTGVPWCIPLLPDRWVMSSESRPPSGSGRARFPLQEHTQQSTLVPRSTLLGRMAGAREQGRGRHGQPSRTEGAAQAPPSFGQAQATLVLTAVLVKAFPATRSSNTVGIRGCCRGLCTPEAASQGPPCPGSTLIKNRGGPDWDFVMSVCPGPDNSVLPVCDRTGMDSTLPARQ